MFNSPIIIMKKSTATFLFSLLFLSVFSCRTRDTLPGLIENDHFIKVANHFASAMASGNLDGFVSFYSDSVLYRDQVYGSSDYFTQENLRIMFEPLFNDNLGWRIKIITQAMDNKSETLMLKLDVADSLNVVWEYAGWFKFQNGKIIEQLDFSMYPVKDLLESPRFVEYFKESRLKVVPMDSP